MCPTNNREPRNTAIPSGFVFGVDAIEKLKKAQRYIFQLIVNICGRNYHNYCYLDDELAQRLAYNVGAMLIHENQHGTFENLEWKTRLPEMRRILLTEMPDFFNPLSGDDRLNEAVPFILVR